MSTATKLFEPYKLGPLTLPNRLVMAPLTRNRALAGLVPNPLAVEYYGQRASAGLLVSEATPGFAARPGLSGYARHLFQGAGRRLAQGDGPRP